MNVRVARFLDGARSATGRAVIVDVFRAFTTAAFCVAAGAREVVLLADHEEALRMKREDPSLFLTGEIGGRPIEGFDVGNSPSAVLGLDLQGRRVVQRTSSGTQGVVAAERAVEILLGSFVIAEATVRYLRASSGRASSSDVTVVSMGERGILESGEDDACAGYIAARLRDERPNVASIIAALWENEDPAWPQWFPRRDAELACEVDRFDFALPVTREGPLLVARPWR
ncbi:MAG TPA: 2-phosphosulfolactate phosphatase [Candidatus Limnocylindrales bacterium]|nr:2-phosphosulfolactate phosphatase [Candidatus Limnocylindrales bacterium]